MSKKALSAYSQAAELVWPGLTLIKEHIAALEQVRAAGEKGLPPREIKRGLGEAFLALTNSRKGPTAFSDEVCAAMSGDMDRRADIQEENALIRLVQDTDTYHEAYHLTRLGKRLMEAARRLPSISEKARL
ncbi:hypothetical protein [Pseudodesulfovibrio pelocollis]|uniref:hypothetical protein n=1 Tax=Pseudodesulfovibrio pelocollis TaxID=3051432 RepID=UPI00255AB36B|nr:hypothetical protein [Pseudodesulfovibrio sp. SB368]